MAAQKPGYRSRLLDLGSHVGERSLFLLGPRQTGKSTLLRQALPGVPTYSLLDSDVFLRLTRRPALIREEIPAGAELVVIDEIQKLPELLDEVHLAIEERGVRFLLTGSSARKLRRGGVNLLGGRARTRVLHPFVAHELGDDFDLVRALNYGLLPSIYLSGSPREDLAAYAGTYLTQEIAAEGLTRSVPAFSRFLEVAAGYHGQLLSYAGMASDAQVPRSTVQEYFRILTDTLLATELPAWTRTVKREPIRTSKLYFFDGGVAHHLRGGGRIRPRSPLFGAAFEGYVLHEIKTWVDYRTVQMPLHFWRSRSGFEVDFILGEQVAIEVKAKDAVADRDLRGLQALREEGLLRRYIVVGLLPRAQRRDGIELLPWRDFLDQLWTNEIIDPAESDV